MRALAFLASALGARLSFASALGALGAPLLACGGGTRDVVPETHDVIVGEGEAGGNGGYAFIARRPLGFVALANERGLGADAAKTTTDHLADALDACATNLAAKGRLVDGTIRVEATVAEDGAVRVQHMTVAPGDGVAANALLCVMAPLRLTTLGPAGDAKARSFTFDASWGPGGAKAK